MNPNQSLVPKRVPREGLKSILYSQYGTPPMTTIVVILGTNITQTHGGEGQSVIVERYNLSRWGSPTSGPDWATTLGMLDTLLTEISPYRPYNHPPCHYGTLVAYSKWRGPNKGMVSSRPGTHVLNQTVDQSTGRGSHVSSAIGYRDSVTFLLWHGEDTLRSVVRRGLCVLVSSVTK